MGRIGTAGDKKGRRLSQFPAGWRIDHCGEFVPHNDAETRRGLERAAAGDAEGWRALIARHHARLRRLVVLRLDVRLRGRLDPSDVLQEAYLDAAKQLPKYLEQPDLPFSLWLRQLTVSR